MIYQIVKILHIMGFIAAIGVTLATVLTYSQFWKLYAANREHGLAAFRALKALQWVGMMGFFVVLVAGIIMLAILQWSFVSLLWFQIKLGLILLIFINGIIFGRRSALQFEAFLNGKQSSPLSPTAVAEIQNQSRSFFWIQLALYACIIVVSVFRFT